MKLKLAPLAVLLLLLVAFKSSEAFFSGRITYKNSFTTLQGEDISAKLAPFLGAEQHYYISGANYKTYNEKKQLIQLYTGTTGEYIFFKDGQVVQKIDATKPSAAEVKVTPLPQTATILGHACKAVQIEADGVTTVYYYAPDVKVKAEDYANHAFGDWNTYLKATQGGLMLKYVTTNPKVGYVMMGEATAIQPLKMSAAEFSQASVERQ